MENLKKRHANRIKGIEDRIEEEKAKKKLNKYGPVQMSDRDVDEGRETRESHGGDDGEGPVQAQWQPKMSLEEMDLMKPKGY